MLEKTCSSCAGAYCSRNLVHSKIGRTEHRIYSFLWSTHKNIFRSIPVIQIKTGLVKIFARTSKEPLKKRTTWQGFNKICQHSHFGSFYLLGPVLGQSCMSFFATTISLFAHSDPPCLATATMLYLPFIHVPPWFRLNNSILGYNTRYPGLPISYSMYGVAHVSSFGKRPYSEQLWFRLLCPRSPTSG